jgi:hypothetical protein
MDFFKKGQQLLNGNKQNHAGSSSHTTTTGQPGANNQQLDYGDKGIHSFFSYLNPLYETENIHCEDDIDKRREGDVLRKAC